MVNVWSREDVMSRNQKETRLVSANPFAAADNDNLRFVIGPWPSVQTPGFDPVLKGWRGELTGKKYIVIDMGSEIQKLHRIVLFVLYYQQNQSESVLVSTLSEEKLDLTSLADCKYQDL